MPSEFRLLSSLTLYTLWVQCAGAYTSTHTHIRLAEARYLRSVHTITNLNVPTEAKNDAISCAHIHSNPSKSVI